MDAPSYNHIPSILIFDKSLFEKLSKLELSVEVNWVYGSEKLTFIDVENNAAVVLLDKISTDVKCLIEKSSALILSNQNSLKPDIQVSKDYTISQWQRTLETSLKLWKGQQHLKYLESKVDSLKQEQTQLSGISIALSAEKDLDRLLNRVLEEGRNLASCEGASLFLVKEEDKSTCLIFKLTQNELVDTDFRERKIPLNTKSLAGFVAITGEILNIRDVYAIPTKKEYCFDSSFDNTCGYKTRDLLTIPMRNYDNKIIGILQFLNSKNIESFDEEICEKLLALSSQAAVAIDNSLLIENIHTLFEGFVSASVKAIEARDPVTSGHSFRVADYTVELAQALHRSGVNKYNHVEFSREELRELKYAALLHDFGKVGVSERVLLKPAKLDQARLDILRFRILWQKEKLQKDFYKSSLQFTKTSKKELLEKQIRDIEFILNQEIKKLDYFEGLIIQSNKPSILDEDAHEHLCDLKHYKIEGSPWEGNGLISNDDFLRLSVTKGSLTEQERIEIQSHVSHTYEYLLQIPWTPDLKNIPQIAVSHHEKLDGSGYPFGLKETEIPVQSRVMTIADIYDALTARDRPYKNSLSEELSLDILKKEASNGLIDSDLVKIFIDAKIYKLTSETTNG